MPTSEDPWKDISPPTGAATVNGLPVAGAEPWAFYWMVDTEGRRLLGLRYPRAEGKPLGKLPKLKGLSVEDLAASDTENILVWRLLDSSEREIFRSLCDDIISSASNATTHQEALEAAVIRTWHWHRLLRGGADQRLSREEQKGLIGEIRVLTEHVFPRMLAAAALETWTGPFGAPKDFEIGTLAIEAKARRGAAKPEVRISSEHQLDDAGLEDLFLHVLHLATPGPDDTGFCLNDVVRDLRVLVESSDIAALELVEIRLSAVGFRDIHDYSDHQWIELDQTLYRVSEGFPRITATDIATGVSRVTYAISLSECEPFIVEDSVLAEAIGGATDDQ